MELQIKIIFHNRESSSVLVLINESSTQKFIPTKSLKQGDLMPSFLFLVVVEGMLGLVRQVVSQNRLHGVKIGSNQVEVSMLQFANHISMVLSSTMTRCVNC